MLVPAFAAGIEPMSCIGDGRDNLNVPTALIYCLRGPWVLPPTPCRLPPPLTSHLID
jgi:hypothetical protein